MKKNIILLVSFFVFGITALSAQQRDAKTELKEAERMYNNKEYYSASYIYKYFSATLNPEQRYIYAFCLVNSNATQENIAEAIRQLKIAVSGRNAKAMLALYYIYMENRLVPQDRSQAIDFITMAATYENEEGLYIYGTILNDGNFVSRDTVKAYTLIEKAAQKKYYNAIHALGYMHYTGKRAPKDLSKAEYYWKQAADFGTDEALYNYSLLLLETNKNTGTAIANFKSLASKGFASASAYLGYLYLNGAPNTMSDTTKALIYFKQVLYNDNFKKTNKADYDKIRTIVAKFGAIEPVNDSKLLRNVFDELIQSVTRKPNVPETEKDKRKFILNKLEDAYKKLGALGFREGIVRFGKENAPLDTVLLTKPYHIYETDIVQVVTPEAAKQIQQKWVQLLQQAYPEHTMYRGKVSTTGIHFMLRPEKEFIHIYATYFDYMGPGYPLSSQVILKVEYSVRSN